jgi:hypothetical protein
MKVTYKYPDCKDRKISIDVKEITDTSVVCALYTGSHCAQITMSRVDYDALLRKDFFLKDSGELRSEEYYIQSWFVID